jgi:hypothetical protein
MKHLTQAEIRLVASNNALQKVKDALYDLHADNTQCLYAGDTDNGTHANLLANENKVFEMFIDYIKELEATVIAQ